MAEWVRVASVDDLGEGPLCGVEAGGQPLVLVRADDGIYALEDQCSHQDFPLSEGEVDDSTIECALHGARFDVKTGKALSLPAVRPVKTFEVEVRDSDIYVNIG